VAPAAVRDPTGCGDAYRAGILYGLLRSLSWEDTGRLGALLGAIKIAHQGTQNHHFTPESIRADFRKEFGHGLAI
jgi:adenosine kinase